MFTRATDAGYREALPGIRMKTCVYGAATLLAEFRLAKGHDLPPTRTLMSKAAIS
jgi:hypothetical protein